MTPDFAGGLVGATFMVMAAAVLILRGPIGRALARRLEGPAAGAAEERLAELEQRVHELEVDREELRERVEFAERLLSGGSVPPTELR